MRQTPTLLILAAGMSSRFGRLKLIEGFGPNGESIIDYTIYDAIKIGYKKIVMIIKDEYKELFLQRFEAINGRDIDITFVSQNMSDLPYRYISTVRSKPWGTAHAVWAARYVINGPFVVVNADDFYGMKALKMLHDFATNYDSEEYAVMTYYLGNTISENGGVNRGICYLDGDGYLSKIQECYNISFKQEQFVCTNESVCKLNFGTLVSMNMFLMQSSFFDACEKALRGFLDEGDLQSRELIIPTVLDQMIYANKIKVRTLNTNEKWFGVTFPEDKPLVEQSLALLVHEGRYPNMLFPQWSMTA